MTRADLLEQVVHLLGGRCRMGGFELMDGAVEEFDGPDQVQDAGVGPVELRP